MVGKYKVITLCGSTRFKDQFLAEQKRLTLSGNIVISVGLFGHSGDDEVWSEGTKEMLDDMHKRKIDMADEIFVINVGGYIGASTASEIAYAKATGKRVSYLEKEETQQMPVASKDAFVPLESHNKLNWNAYVHYIMQIPYGKCITDKLFLQFLQKVYNDKQLMYDSDNYPCTGSIDYWKIPVWRHLSANGRVTQPKNSMISYSAQLIAEGHTLEKREHGRNIVKDYKSTEIDYDQFEIMPAEQALRPMIVDQTEPLKAFIAMAQALAEKSK